jgi:Protein of unknown function (DUF3307)
MDPNVSAAAVVAVFTWLEIKHFIFDYVLQTPFQFRNKGTYGHPGGILHSGLQALGTIPAFFILPPGWLLGVIIVIGEFIVHYHVDWTKEQTLRRMSLTTTDAWYWRFYGTDQLAHQLTYVVIAGLLAGVF